MRLLSRSLSHSVAFFTAFIACASTRPEPAPQIDAQAVIGRTDAWFVFPIDSSKVFTYDSPQPRTYEGSTEFIWEISWDQPDDQHGNDPHALALITHRRLGGPRTGSLSMLVSRDSLAVLTECTTCDAVASIPETDADVFAEVKNGRLIFRVRGKAVHRVFPAIPDSVTFFRAHRDPDAEETIRVRVARKTP